jgi:8-oxo-dGTP pyrophosphatase MutT (NUDIX family)
MARMKSPVLSAGVVVVRFAADGCRYLLLRAYRYWDFPKGLVEPGEDPMAAARREAWEEAGLVRLAFRWGPTFMETPPYGSGKIARYYVAETEQVEIDLPISPELGRPEHHEYRWPGYDEACGLLVPRVATILDWARAVTGCDGVGV